MSDTSVIIESGFYDSINQDRLYSADDMNKPYKDLISEGVYGELAGSASTSFLVSRMSGMRVSVAPGKALLGGRWVLMTEGTAMSVPGNDTVNQRTDSVILRVDVSESARNATLIYRTGSVTQPALILTEEITETRLANIVVASGATSISDSDVTDKRTYAKLNIGNDQLEEVLLQIIDDHPELVTTIPDGSITTDKLASLAVTRAKIADKSINYAKIADRTIKMINIANTVDLYNITGDAQKFYLARWTHDENPIALPFIHDIYTSSYVDEQLNGKADAVTETASGSIASFSDGADDIPMKSVIAGIEAAQSGSGDPSPTNIRPISGWSEVNVWNDPKYGGSVAWNQLVPIPSSAITTTANGVTLTDNRDGSYTLSGTATEQTIFAIVPQKTWTANHKYVLRGCPSDTTGCSLAMRGQAGDTIDNGNGAIWNPGTMTWKGIVIYAENGATFNSVKFVPTITDITSAFGSTIADYIYSLEQSTAGAGVAWFRNLFPNDYYPYNSGEQTCVSAVNGDPYLKTTVPLGQTVYGGSLNVTTGLLTITHDIVDLGTLNYEQYSTRLDDNRFMSLNAIAKPIESSAVRGNCICSQYNTVSNVDTYNAITGIAITQLGKIVIYDPSLSLISPGAFKTAMSGVQLVYELATPQTVQLNPTEVKSLLGDNNIWADTGDIEVEYCADTKLYINDVLPTAPSENGTYVLKATVLDGNVTYSWVTG